MSLRKYILAAFLVAICLAQVFGAGNVYINNQRVAGATTNGTSWANAWVSITNSNQGAAGDTNWVAFCHNETPGPATNITLNGVGTFLAPCLFLCCDTNSAPPTTLTNTAVVWTKTTGVLSYNNGYDYTYGIKFYCGTGASSVSFGILGNASGWYHAFDTCVIGITNTSVSSRITAGVSSAIKDEAISFNNVQFVFGASGQGITAPTAKVIWQNSTNAIQGTAPTNLFSTAVTSYANWDIRGVDLSGVTGATSSLFNMGTANQSSPEFKFTDCKIGASIGMTVGTTSGPGGPKLTLYNCDSANTNYRFYKFTASGTEQHETTIVRTGGATDGVTTFSRKLISAASDNYWTPLTGEWIYGWNTNLTTTTLGVEIITDSLTNQNNQVWLEVESLSTSGVPLGVFADNSNTNMLMTAGNHPLSTKTWTTNGLTSPIKQTLSVSVTPTGSGFYRGRVKVAKPSLTIYYDPMFTNGYANAYMSGSDGIINSSSAINTPAPSTTPIATEIRGGFQN